MKLTEWYGYKQKPVRKGVYKTRMCNITCERVVDEFYSFWNGKYWSNGFTTIGQAEKSKGKGIQEKVWQGIMK